MVASKTPTLGEIKNKVSLDDARAILSLAICEVCDFLNVGKNMSDTQIAITVDLILGNYWYLKPEEVKYCLRRAMMREKVYDRLDGNVILGWIKDYDTERTEAAVRISEKAEAKAAAEFTPSTGAVTYQQWVEQLRGRAPTDKSAAEMLKMIGETPHTPEDIARHTDCKTDKDAKDRK